MAIKPQIIPTYLFNEHNEAYFYWHKSRHKGTLKKALDIYHVDAHSDMAKLQELRHSMYWNEVFLHGYFSVVIVCKSALV